MVLVFAVLLSIYLAIAILFRENGLFKYIKLKSIETKLQAEIKGIKKQDEDMKKQIETLKKDPNLIEELAREQGLMKEGELIFKYEDER